MPGWEICGSGTQMHDAQALIQALSPDMVASDLSLIDGSVERLAFRMQCWPRRPQLLLLTPTADDTMLFEGLRAGASGYCVDADGGQALRDGLAQLADGRARMSPRLARLTLTAFSLSRTRLADADTVAGGQDQTPLTNLLAQGLFRNEHHLLSLLAHGRLSAEIGQRWRIGQSNVERRLWRIYTKLHALYRQPVLT